MEFHRRFEDGKFRVGRLRCGLRLPRKSLKMKKEPFRVPVHVRFKLYRQLSAQLFSFKPRVCKLTFSLAKSSFSLVDFSVSPIGVDIRFNFWTRFVPVSFKIRCEATRPELHAFGSPSRCWVSRVILSMVVFLSVERTAYCGVIVNRRRQDFLISLLPNVVRVGDLYSTSSAG